MQSPTIYPSLAGQGSSSPEAPPELVCTGAGVYPAGQGDVDQNEAEGLAWFRRYMGKPIPSPGHHRYVELHQAIASANQQGLSVLINNAANDMRQSPEDVSEASWRDCMAVNLDAAFCSASSRAHSGQPRRWFHHQFQFH